MGSFDVACGLSHITIHCGDPAVFVPLEPTWSAEYVDLEHGCSNIVSNDGAYTLWHPMTLPIRGVYDDYGRLGEIEEGPNTKAIEEHFGISINQFLSLFFDHWDNPERPEGFPEKFAGMFVHAEIYDKFAKCLRDEWKANGRSVLKGADLSSYVLERLGFVRTDEDLGGRYNLMYVWPGNEEFYLASDGQWSRFHGIKKHYKESDGGGSGIYHPEALAELCAAYDVHLPIEGLDEVPVAVWAWDELSQDLQRREAKIAERQAQLDAGEISQSDFEFWTRMDSYSIRDNRQWDRMLMTARPLDKKPTLQQCYHSCIVNGDETIRDEMVAWHNVFLAFHNCNQLIGPSWNGLQHGCDEYSLELASETIRILNKRIEELLKNREEDERWHAEYEAKQIAKFKKKKKSKKKKVTIKREPPYKKTAKKKTAKKKSKKKKTKKKVAKSTTEEPTEEKPAYVKLLFHACTFVENGQDGSVWLNFFPDRDTALIAAQKEDQRFENDIQETKLELAFSGQRTEEGLPILGLAPYVPNESLEEIPERFVFDAYTFVEDGQDGSVWRFFYPDHNSALEAAQGETQRFENDVQKTPLVLTLSKELSEDGMSILRIEN